MVGVLADEGLLFGELVVLVVGDDPGEDGVLRGVVERPTRAEVQQHQVLRVGEHSSLPLHRELGKDELGLLTLADEALVGLQSLEDWVEERGGKSRYAPESLLLVALVLEVDDVLLAFRASHQSDGPSLVHVAIRESHFQILQGDRDLGQLVRGVQDRSDFDLIESGVLRGACQVIHRGSLRHVDSPHYEQTDVLALYGHSCRSLLDLDCGWCVLSFVLLDELEVLFLARVDVALQELLFRRDQSGLWGGPRELTQGVDQVTSP